MLYKGRYTFLYFLEDSKIKQDSKTRPRTTVLSVFNCKKLEAIQFARQHGSCAGNPGYSVEAMNHMAKWWQIQKKKSGPSIEPCGTPRDMTVGEEIKLLQSVSYVKTI